MQCRNVELPCTQLGGEEDIECTEIQYSQGGWVWLGRAVYPAEGGFLSAEKTEETRHEDCRDQGEAPSRLRIGSGGGWISSKNIVW